MPWRPGAPSRLMGGGGTCHVCPPLVAPLARIHCSDPAEEIFEHEAFKAKDLKSLYYTILNNFFSLTNIHPYELFPYDLYSIRYFGTRYLSGTTFHVYEYLPLRTLYHTIFISYTLSTDEFLVTNIWHTNIIDNCFVPTPPAPPSGQPPN